MAKDRTATEKLNVALAGLDSALTIIQTLNDGQEPLAKTIEKAREYAEEVREHLLTIQFHAAQI